MSYHAVPQDLQAMLECLASGYNIVGGISVYEGYERAAETGFWELPRPGESLLGGHAAMYFGYDHHKGVFHGLNSWGSEWGKEGKFEIPFEYLTHPGLASDFWTIKLVEE